MNRDLKDKVANDPQYIQKRAQAKNAYLNDCWIYSNISEKWYTPEEFMASGENVQIFRGKNNEKQFSIRDPRAGLEEMLHQMGKLQQQLEAHSKKMKDYFDLKNKKNSR